MKDVLCVLIVAIVSATFCAPTILAGDPQISLTLIGPQAPLKAGSELKVKVILKNLSDGAVGVTNHGPEGPGQYGPYVEVRDAQGSLVPQTEYYRSRQGGQDGSFFTDAVEVGESRESSLIISRLYDMSKPGKYTVQVQRAFGKTVIKSNTIAVTVTK